MLLALLLILDAAVTPAPNAVRPPPAFAPSNSRLGSSPDAATQNATSAPDASCRSKNERDIVVCAQRNQEYRLDPSVMDAEQEAKSASRSASAPMPAAQAICSSQPTGCGTGLEGLDLANAAVVIGTAAIKAARGEDWTRPFKTGGSDEYQLYLQAKQRREAREEQQRAEAAALKARQANR